MFKTALLSAFVLSALAVPAFAECSGSEEAATGKAISTAAAAAVSKVVAVEGKQMVNLSMCETSPGGIYAEFKFNFLGADGLYWVEGNARMQGASLSEIKLKKLSPNLADASAKTGIKVAAK
ncbi:hypothetical protein PQU92_17590 [Asticcacaulis sp. BYS171W]|uniref:Lipoprotein n=1 Tax=Asticcacaulis aquaticus TaxID=2984212 RepID=A0ABT5I090_9CAUL|nr:hypothetical protein [Asticcacaulis aquaticus]